MLENEVIELIKEKLFNGIGRFHIMKKEQKETRDNRKKEWVGKRKEREVEERKKTREVSTFTKDKAVILNCLPLAALELK